MAEYLLIESRDPFESESAVRDCAELARGLVDGAHVVTMFLVQNGVLPARSGAKSQHLAALVRAGVAVIADDFSLRERGIDASRLVSGVVPGPIDTVVDRMAQGHKVLWH
jgi:intracellular sulfur oxidation DsrE/DsrF family protein